MLHPQAKLVTRQCLVDHRNQWVPQSPHGVTWLALDGQWMFWATLGDETSNGA